MNIAVLMSGGVDSSVTAFLLKKKGYNVIGVTMRLPLASKPGLSCNGEDAKKIANQLNIKHYLIDVSDKFNEFVINPFRDDYLCGRTPSPCVDCNEKVKFGYLLDIIKNDLKIKYVATGHYAKIYKYNGWHLGRGRDLNRDQSYFLYGIKKENLPFIKFPLEPYTKQEVRQIAQEAGFHIAEKPDSMELCFAGEGNYRDAINSSKRCGNIIDTNGNFLKKHNGIENYTIGQRKGLGVSAPYPLYVTNINPFTNTITLGKKEDGITNFVEINKINIIENNKATEKYKCFGKIRSNGNPKLCYIEKIEKDYAKIIFNEPFFKSAPGQKTVLYDDKNNIILGGTSI